MEDSVARYYIVNDTVRMPGKPGISDITSDAVYEVIRMVNECHCF